MPGGRLPTEKAAAGKRFGFLPSCSVGRQRARERRAGRAEASEVGL